MPTIAEAREAVYQLFVTGWGTRTPIALDNETFDKPVDSNNEPTAWVRLTVRNTGSQQDTLGPIGARNFLRTGSIFVNVYTAKDKGTTEGDGHAQKARELLEGLSFASGAVRTYNVVVRELGPERDSPYYAHVAEASFEFDEKR